MKISLTWKIVDKIIFKSNNLFLSKYYKIKKIERWPKYKLEFWEQNVCYPDFIIDEKLDSLKHIAQVHAAYLIYYYTLGNGIKTSKCISIH